MRERTLPVAEGFAQTRTIMKWIIRESDPFNPLLSKVLMATWAAPRPAQPNAIPQPIACLTGRMWHGQ